MTVLDPRTIVSIMGGTVVTRDSCNVPGPGHSKADRSLSIKIDPTKPLGVTFSSFAKDNRRDCYDYIAAALGLKREATPRSTRPAAVLTSKPARETSAYSLRLFYEAISAA